MPTCATFGTFGTSMSNDPSNPLYLKPMYVKTSSLKPLFLGKKLLAFLFNKMCFTAELIGDGLLVVVSLLK